MRSIQSSFAKPIAFFKRDFKIATSYRLNYVTQGFGIILTTFSFFLLSKMLGGNEIPQLEPYGGDYFSFVLIGIALTDYFTISTNTFANEIRTSQVMGTLESLLVTPTSIITILLSSYVYKLFSTSFRIFFYILVGVFLFTMHVQPVNVGALFCVFTLTLLPFFGLGLISASFIIVFKQGNPIGGLMAMSSGLLGGVMYPVTVLPSWLKPFSVILPITHGLEAIRQVLLNGEGFMDIRPQLLILAILSVLSLATGIVSIYSALKIAKREGSLLHY
ncbi:MAG: ABC transporter permease [Desulfocapsa sp.]|nr:MAG: ABC transporter permease [Desulfocapsa sp.]